MMEKIPRSARKGSILRREALERFRRGQVSDLGDSEDQALRRDILDGIQTLENGETTRNEGNRLLQRKKGVALH